MIMIRWKQNNKDDERNWVGVKGYDNAWKIAALVKLMFIWRNIRLKSIPIVSYMLHNKKCFIIT